MYSGEQGEGPGESPGLFPACSLEAEPASQEGLVNQRDAAGVTREKGLSRSADGTRAEGAPDSRVHSAGGPHPFLHFFIL